MFYILIYLDVKETEQILNLENHGACAVCFFFQKIASKGGYLLFLFTTEEAKEFIKESFLTDDFFISNILSDVF